MIAKRKKKVNKTHVVVLFELTIEVETLDATQQMNEVFGPFPDDKSAEDWAKFFLDRAGNPRFRCVVIPLQSSDLKVD